MKYRTSSADERNFGWFASDISRASLKYIHIRSGPIRGIRRLRIDFEYPITAIAGRNGSGKSTLLALAACAFHNHPKGYCPPNRRVPYYTFSDFFVQSKDELPLEGVHIDYGILHNRWKRSSRFPDGKGLGQQSRVKRRGGRWNNYDQRVKRPVVYLGMDRVVPHAERSVTKLYKSHFRTGAPAPWEDRVMKQAARILNIEYSNLWYTHYTRYRLAVARTADATYSGFNMGAGEDALLELLVTVQSCPEGALVLVDEIELGLHEEAQWRLIQELKQLCSERHLQIICTTHSPRVLEALPPKARIFLERLKDQTVALTGISSAFATGKLGGRSSDELFIYVEDGVAESIVNSALSLRQRERVRIIPIGSAPAVMRQLAARYREGLAPDALAVLDGDKRRERQSHIKMFRSALESSSDVANAWVEDRVTFLPGDSWPERAVLMALGEAQFSELASHFGATPEEVSVAVPRALRASKHAEFYELADLLRVKLDTAVTVAVHAAIGAWTAEVEILRCAVDKLLQW